MSQYGYLHVVQALHGDCFVLEYNDKGDRSGFMIIDGGPGNTYNRGKDQYRTTEHLLHLLSDLSTGNSNREGSRLLESVDTVVVTHDHADHRNGIADLFRYLLQVNSPLGSWKAGLDLINRGSPPIKKIWYNSQMNMIKQILKHDPSSSGKVPWLDPLKNPKAGWFDSLLDTYKQSCNQLQLEFSQEFVAFKRAGLKIDGQDKPKTLTDVNLVYAGAAPGLNLATRGQFSFQIIGPYFREALMKSGLIDELIKASEYEENRVSDEEIPREPDRSYGLFGTAKGSDLDSSPANRSSIAFCVTDKTGLVLQDTKLLMLGDAALASKIEHGEYTIMKIAHHGSSHNNFLVKHPSTTDHECGIKVSAELLNKTVRFFYFVKAKVYVISASPTESQSPNPHITTLLGIYIAAVALRRKDEKRRPVAVYLTNKIPGNAWRGIGKFLLDPGGVDSSSGKRVLGKNNDDIIHRLKDFDKHMRMWCLKPGTSYESIPIYDRKDIGDPDPDDPNNPNNESKWIRCSKDYLLDKGRAPKRAAVAAKVHSKAAVNVGGAKIPKKKKP